MKKIRRTQIADLAMPLPPLAEQVRIAARLDEQMAEIAKLRRSLDSQLTEINALPAALLRRAFSGEL